MNKQYITDHIGKKKKKKNTYLNISNLLSKSLAINSMIGYRKLKN